MVFINQNEIIELVQAQPPRNIAILASFNSSLTHQIMATSGPRAARSVLSGVASISRRLKPSNVRSEVCNSSPLSFQQRPSPSRPFSTTYRYAATPASSYVRKAAEPAKQPPKPTSAAIDDISPIKDMTGGLADEPLILDEGTRQVDWTRSFHGLSSQPFSKEAADVLLAPIPFDDVEVKPDGIIYLPEIKYRRILNRAFGPGGWGLAPRGETIVTGKSITREYALVAHGRYVWFYAHCQWMGTDEVQNTD